MGAQASATHCSSPKATRSTLQAPAPAYNPKPVFAARTGRGWDYLWAVVRHGIEMQAHRRPDRRGFQVSDCFSKQKLSFLCSILSHHQHSEGDIPLTERFTFSIETVQKSTFSVTTKHRAVIWQLPQYHPCFPATRQSGPTCRSPARPWLFF